MRKILLLTAIAAASGAHAGGFENARLDTAFMYEEGNSASISTSRRNFDVKGDAFATTKSVIGDRSATTLAAKYQVNENLALGVTRYDSGAIHLNYQGAGGDPSVSAFGPKVNLTSDSIAVMAKYDVSKNISVAAGLRHDTFKVADADIYRLTIASAAGVGAAATVSSPTVSGGADTVPVFAVAYHIPDIALRVELLHQANSSVALDTTCNIPATLGLCSAQSTGGLAQYTTLNFQSGIMEDTLLFGSIHKGKWSKSQLSVADTENPLLGQLGPTSAFEDSTEFSLGIGRKFSDSLSGSFSYNWEKAGDGKTGSLFTVNDGYKGVSVGAKYTMENIELSAGYNYTKLGDVTYTHPTGAIPPNNYSGSSVSAFGARLTARF